MGFIRRPFQLLWSNKRYEENKRKIGQELISMEQVDYQCRRPTPWMQESVSMHKSPTPVRHSRMDQTSSEEEEKRGGETGKTEARGLMERKTAQQNKKQKNQRKWNKAYLGTAKVNPLWSNFFFRCFSGHNLR